MDALLGEGSALNAPLTESRTLAKSSSILASECLWHVVDLVGVHLCDFVDAVSGIANQSVPCAEESAGDPLLTACSNCSDLGCLCFSLDPWRLMRVISNKGSVHFGEKFPFRWCVGSSECAHHSLQGIDSLGRRCLHRLRVLEWWSRPLVSNDACNLVLEVRHDLDSLRSGLTAISSPHTIALYDIIGACYGDDWLLCLLI